MPALIQAKRTAVCAVILSLGGVASAAEPAPGRGAAMLDALRHRDAAERWAATDDAFRPADTLSAPPAPLPPVVQSPVTPPGGEFRMQEDSWRSSRSTAGRVSLDAPPARIAAQESPRDRAYDPPVPIPDAPADQDFGLEAEVQPVARTPDELRKITDILPYFDYSPDPEQDDPCLYLCPRPDGQPCKEYPEGEFVPPCPDEIGLGTEPYVPRSMPPSTYAWAASNVSYNPLYFEDTQLERYGHTYGDCVQPFVSLGRFSVQLIGLPYQMALDPPCKEVYPLGYYRPGEPAPKLCYQIPFNAKAAAIAAGVYTGIGVVLP